VSASASIDGKAEAERRRKALMARQSGYGLAGETQAQSMVVHRIH
jgi:hypothetical protein